MKKGGASAPPYFLEQHYKLIKVVNLSEWTHKNFDSISDGITI